MDTVYMIRSVPPHRRCTVCRMAFVVGDGVLKATTPQRGYRHVGCREQP